MTILLNAKNQRELETKLLQSLRKKQVDGIIIMGGRVDEVNLQKHYIKAINYLNMVIPVFYAARKQTGLDVQVSMLMIR